MVLHALAICEVRNFVEHAACEQRTKESQADLGYNEQSLEKRDHQ
jgi:hypothetical protein